ncbi:uncharacterized protein DUF4157 [Streptomyces sp. CG 926]|uniref:eCIS core domain-containing protein n=1 Tax=Streptomyces sp. CG 926 TaxID=1882405 RepID=UPI000D6CCC2F|nr:uncharacterized protein DUF4157 [Streptomyces sp. CG 926]
MKREREQPERPAPAPRAPLTRPQDRSGSPAPGSPAPGPGALAALQRTAGNAAVARMVQRSSVHRVLDARGEPLEPSLRGEMEARLGADFSDVRIHTGSTAQRSAAEIGARAYTSGNHVVVGRGGGDKHTLAHELTHVIQQRTGPVSGTDTGDGLKVSDPSDTFERAAEANAVRVMRGTAPAPASAPAAEPAHGPHAAHGPHTAHAEHGADPAHAPRQGGEAAVQRALPMGLAPKTPVVKHEDDGDSTKRYEISKFNFGSYLIAETDDPQAKKLRVSPSAKEWGTVEGREESRRNYEAARRQETDPAVVAAEQKRKDLDLGENYLSADYRRINPLLAAFAQVGFAPDEIADPAFSYRSKEDAVLRAWRELAVARGYADEAAAASWDSEHLRNTYEIYARINGVWSDFPVPSANADGKVMRGDSKHLYESFGGILRPDEHPDGGYVTVGRTIVWPAILSTTFGDPLTHSYVAGKEIVWEFGLPEGHKGRSLGANNQSEQEMTFPLGTKIRVDRILVRTGEHREEQADKFGKSAVVVVFADILDA